MIPGYAHSYPDPAAGVYPSAPPENPEYRQHAERRSWLDDAIKLFVVSIFALIAADLLEEVFPPFSAVLDCVPVLAIAIWIIRRIQPFAHYVSVNVNSAPRFYSWLSRSHPNPTYFSDPTDDDDPYELKLDSRRLRVSGNSIKPRSRPDYDERGRTMYLARHSNSARSSVPSTYDITTDERGEGMGYLQPRADWR